MMMISARALSASVSNITQYQVSGAGGRVPGAGCRVTGPNSKHHRLKSVLLLKSVPLILQRLLPFHSLQEGEIGEHFTGAQHHRGEWVVCDGHGQTSLSLKSLIQIPQQRSTSGQNDTTVDDVS